ncbi:MAG: transcriptional repressor [Actinomycetota bacterium]
MRRTAQRDEVLEALAGGEALAAQELHERLRARGSRTGLATVYRTLRMLADDGSVDVLRDDVTQARFRLCSAEHHHHLLCETCGSVVEIPDCEVDGWARKVARAHGFTVRTHQAEIVGMCRACAKTPPAR